MFLDIQADGIRIKEYLKTYLNPKPKEATDKKLNKVSLGMKEQLLEDTLSFDTRFQRPIL